jgi:hypothetical protein
MACLPKDQPRCAAGTPDKRSALMLDWHQDNAETGRIGGHTISDFFLGQMTGSLTRHHTTGQISLGSGQTASLLRNVGTGSIPDRDREILLDAGGLPTPPAKALRKGGDDEGLRLGRGSRRMTGGSKLPGRWHHKAVAPSGVGNAGWQPFASVP